MMMMKPLIITKKTVKYYVNDEDTDTDFEEEEEEEVEEVLY